MRMTLEAALAIRQRAQALVAPGLQDEDATLAAARRSAGLQAQDLFAAALGARTRSAGSSLAGFEKSRLERRSVTWTWLMRGTLHVVPTEDLDWYLAVVGPPLIAGTARRRAELGLDESTYEAALRIAQRRLRDAGPLTRAKSSPAASTQRGCRAGTRSKGTCSSEPRWKVTSASDRTAATCRGATPPSR